MLAPLRILSNNGLYAGRSDFNDTKKKKMADAAEWRVTQCFGGPLIESAECTFLRCGVENFCWGEWVVFRRPLFCVGGFPQ